jgi:flagellar biosynthetic protein FlhB
MAQGEDKESKTEEPTEKKVADALEKGNVPRSREISIFASLLGVLAGAAFLIAPSAMNLTDDIALLLDQPAGFSLASGHEANALLWAVSLRVGDFLWPVIGILTFSGLAAALFQHAPSFALDQIKPKWSRISPASGWQRIFGSRGFVEFGKALFKFGAIAIVCLVMLGADRREVIGAMLLDPNGLPGLVLTMVMRLVSAVCAAIVMLVAADIVWSRFRWRADLRMTRQEVKDELKQAEGDPLIKARLRSLARDRARRRMMAVVPKATVVIANPTHYAVALKYERTKGGAPVVVAKGVDLIALRIREIAAQHSVPVVEDKPLARALYDAVEVDQWIPPEFYRAIAKILHFIYSRPGHATAH